MSWRVSLQTGCLDFKSNYKETLAISDHFEIWRLKPYRFSIFPFLVFQKLKNIKNIITDNPELIWVDYLSPSSTNLRLQLNCGNFTLTWAESDGSLWIGATSQATVPVATELFGFGSGGFVRQSEAEDTMSDASSTGRWICFAISDPNSLVILEKGRKVQEHLEGQTFWNKAQFWKIHVWFVCQSIQGNNEISLVFRAGHATQRSHEGVRRCWRSQLRLGGTPTRER